MDRQAYFKRVRDILNPEQARGETLTFIGVGSGGARAAEEATRFGPGRIILVDRPDERLEEHNVIRHVLGYRDLGRLKVEALREHILNINPACDVETAALDVTVETERLAELVARSTQVYLCTDNERSKHVVNEAVVRAGIPMIFAAVFDGGCGGEAGRVMPGGACYACMAAYLNRSDRFDEQKAETFDYSRPAAEEKSTAALNIDIAQIALIQARIGLLTMLAKHDTTADFRGNYILFGNRPVEGLFPKMLCSDIWEIPRDPNCMICGGQESDAQAEVAADEILRDAVRRAG